MKTEENKPYYLRCEQDRVQMHCKQSVKNGTPATLTVDEWLASIDFFHGKCAYCQVNPYSVLEHILPTCFGGGTTKENCVPACVSCNLMKKEYIPYSVDEDICLTEKLERVRNYIQSRRHCEQCKRIRFHDLETKACLKCGFIAVGDRLVPAANIERITSETVYCTVSFPRDSYILRQLAEEAKSTGISIAKLIPIKLYAYYGNKAE